MVARTKNITFWSHLVIKAICLGLCLKEICIVLMVKHQIIHVFIESFIPLKNDF